MSDKPIVMIIDDNLNNIQVIAPTLLEMGLEVSTRNDAINIVENVKAISPSLILMDVMMPEVNGFEACRLLKACVETQNIPIIFLTARTETEATTEGFKSGGADYIHKPFKSEELQARVSIQINLQTETRQRIAHQKKLEETVAELKLKINEIEQLKELLPICCGCKKIRDDKGYWSQVEEYFAEHSDIQFSHSLCPCCVREIYPDIAERVLKKTSSAND